ncbi:WD40 repeat-like protein [Gonapodya prolifera JEL478]|uniref:WD40 repeat-like protein n=1 Tax=Gonapodya prolifera (strain JEL478) TaxID=1344416 RepID=A0A139B0A7_GONPJ|nr:WD40 repeat-like protein [Gonapodya prolifera JEL478]|eukprot:KXS22135.1 WD40 repeat-like protein [Gonapodya prolifera JEL478]
MTPPGDDEPDVEPSPPPSHQPSNGGGPAREDDDDDAPDVGPVPTASNGSGGGGANSDSDLDSDEDGEDEDADVDAEDGPIPPPVESEAALRHHTKLVSALSIDPSGARFVTGSYDYNVNIHDFAGMDARLRPFRSFEGVEGCPVRDLAWSISGDRFLMATTAFFPKLFDRDGNMVEEFIKGDQYLVDPKRTKGHTAPLSSISWHPTDRNRFLTAAGDSTVRIWDVTNKRSHLEVIPLKSRRRGTSGAQSSAGVRTAVTAARFSRDASKIACIAQDGALRVYSAKGPFVNPTVTWDEAHEPGTETAGLLWRADDKSIVTRGYDGMVKIWDLRATKGPVAARGGFSAMAPESDVCLSPDERLIVVGTAGERGGGGRKAEPAALVFLDAQDLSVRKVAEVVAGGNITSDIPAGVVRVTWHPRLNQVFCSTGGGDVGVRVFYGKGSMRGALQSVGRAVRKKRVDEMEGLLMGWVCGCWPILTPAATLRGEVTSVKRKREKDHATRLAVRKPEAPATGQGKAGKIGYSLHEQLLKPYIKQDLRRLDDPREAFLRHAEEAEQNPTFIAPAYSKTQPKPVFDYQALEDEEHESKRRAVEEGEKAKAEGRSG